MAYTDPMWLRNMEAAAHNAVMKRERAWQKRIQENPPEPLSWASAYAQLFPNNRSATVATDMTGLSGSRLLCRQLTALANQEKFQGKTFMDIAGNKAVDSVKLNSPDGSEFIDVWFLGNKQFVMLIQEGDDPTVISSFTRQLHPTKDRQKFLADLRQRLVKRAAERELAYAQSEAKVMSQ